MISPQEITNHVKGLRFWGGEWSKPTTAELEAHVIAWYAVYEQTGTALTLSETYGQAPEQMMATGQRKAAERETVRVARHNRYAGARALRSKYGDDLAEKIIASHTR